MRSVVSVIIQVVALVYMYIRALLCVIVFGNSYQTKSVCTEVATKESGVAGGSTAKKTGGEPWTSGLRLGLVNEGLRP